MIAFYLSLLDDPVEKRDFEKIYNSYRKQMVLTANSILHNEADSEDVVHDVFVCIATKHLSLIKTIQNNNDLRYYLLTATKNTAINKLKKNSKTISIEEAESSKLNDFEDISDDDFVDILCTKAEYEEVIKALLSLKEPYKNILYYHFVLELSVPEAAKLLDRKVPTAKKQLVRGKKMLLNLLKQSRGDDVNDKQ